MPFWLILIKLAKLLATIRKYGALLQALSSGKLVQGIIGQLIVGEVTGRLVAAGVPIDRIDFIEQAREWIGKAIDESAGDLAKSGIVLLPDAIDALLKEEIGRLVLGKSVANGKSAVRGQRRGADPVLLHRGEFERTSVDLLLHGAGTDLLFRRVYRSGADFMGPFGRGWDHAYNLRILEHDENVLALMNGNLGVSRFVRHPKTGQAGFDYFTPPNGVHDAIVADPGGSFTVLRAGGGAWEFGVAGPREHRLIRMVERGGSSQRLEYDAEGRLARINVNGDARHLLFAYDSGNRISRIEDHAGRRCDYAYDEYGYLSSCRQTVEVAGKPLVGGEQYGYTAVGALRRLAHVSDERGVPIVDNVYDTDRASDSFGYLLSQTTEAGATHFAHEVLNLRTDDIDPVDQPVLRIFERGPDGHVIERVFNDQGNELLRREDYTDGGRVRTALIRTRYNADGAVVARMDPEGGVTQYLFGRDQHDPARTWSGCDLCLADVTLAQRMSFGNTIARVERGAALTPLDQAAEQDDWIAALPDPWARAGAQDAIVKSVFDPLTRLLLSQSDPRATESPNPLHAESAPPGAPAHNPGDPRAVAHARLLTRYTYDADGLLHATVYPQRSRPAGLGGPALDVREHVAARDALGRPTLSVDRAGHAWFLEYFPGGPAPADQARAGFPKRELRPHADWPLDQGTPDLLEVRRQGGWSALADRLRSTGPAAIEFDLEGSRIELWQTGEGAIGAGHTAVAVLMDGVAVGSWDQSAEARFVLANLARGGHTLRLESSAPTPFALGRVRTHVATDFEVDLLGRTVRQTDPRGVVTDTTYDALDRVIHKRRGSAMTVEDIASEFNRDGQLVRERSGWTDDQGLPLGGGAIEKTYRYSARGLLVQESVGALDGSAARSERYYYDQRAQPVGMRDARGVRTAFRYDALGRRTHVVHAACTPDEGIEFYRYDRCGRVLRERDPEGGARNNSYDARGRLTTVTDKLGHLTVISHDAAARETVTRRFARRADGSHALALRSETLRDEHGDVIALRFALLDAALPTADPLSKPDAAFTAALIAGTAHEAVTLYQLDAAGRQVRIVDPVGGVSLRRFDPAGRSYDTSSPTGRRIVRLYDGAGSPVRAYAFEAGDGAVFVEEYEHDALGRKIVRRDAIGNTWRTAYDSLGRVLRTEDPLGTVSTFVHNAFGEEVESHEGRQGMAGPALRSTLKRYDGAGNLVGLTDGKGSRYRFDFDLRNRQRLAINLSDPADPGAVCEYDRASRLVRAVDRNGLVQKHTYDAEGHRTATVFDASLVAPAHQLSPLAAGFIKVDYDALGRPVRHENDWSLVEQVRNSAGLVLKETTTLNGGGGAAPRSWSVVQTYDAAGRRTRLTLPSGRSATYSNDAAGRVTEVVDALRPPGYPGAATGTPVILARYDYAGQRWRRTRLDAAGATLDAHYDARGQVCERIVTDNAGGATLWRSQVLFDGAARPMAETSAGGGGGRSRRYAFDRLDQVTGYADQAPAWFGAAALAPPVRPQAPAASTLQAGLDAFVAALAPALPAFDYDAVGNRLASTEPGLAALPSSPDAANRYLQVGGTPWTHDLEGRLLNDGARSFAYDGDDQLCTETLATASGFLRDALGRVVACIVAGGVDYHAYCARLLVARFGATPPLEALPGRLADEALHLAEGGADTWLVHDGLRSPRLLLRRGASAADVVISHRPFGSVEGAAAPAIPFGFAGLLALPGSALLHAANRSYRTDIGRFIQQDPAGFADGANRYLYARNNPLAMFDPLGLQALTPSDMRILDVLEKYAAELLKDVTHNKLTASAAGSNKHLEMQFATGKVPITELAQADAMRIAPEIHIDDKGVIVAVDMAPNSAAKNMRTVDIAIVKEGVAGGRDGIVGKKAEDVLDYVIDYKTSGTAGLEKRLALEELIGGKPVVKLTGKVGELAQALTKRFARLAAVKAAKKMALKNAAKWGMKRAVKAIPIVGGLFTYATAEGSQGERVARAVAGEIGWGPFDLEMGYDALAMWSNGLQEMHEEDPDTYYLMVKNSTDVMMTPY